MELTNELMGHAHFARGLDTDTDFAQYVGSEKARVWGREMADPEFNPTFAPECVACYEAGKGLLAQYTLSYSPRYVKGTVRPEIPDAVVAWTEVSAGYLAFNEACRLAMFRARTKADYYRAQYIEERITPEDVTRWFGRDDAIPGTTDHLWSLMDAVGIDGLSAYVNIWNDGGVPTVNIIRK